MIFFLGFYNYRCTRSHFYQFRISYPIRGNDDYLITRIQNSLKDIIERLFCSIGNYNVSSCIRKSINLAITFRYGFAQFHNTRNRRIFRITSVDGRFSRFFYINWGIEIRLSHSKADNILSLCFHFFGKCVNTQSERWGNTHCLFRKFHIYDPPTM